jgi:hypothetical protein
MSGHCNLTSDKCLFAHGEDDRRPKENQQNGEDQDGSRAMVVIGDPDDDVGGGVANNSNSNVVNGNGVVSNNVNTLSSVPSNSDHLPSSANPPSTLDKPPLNEIKANRIRQKPTNNNTNNDSSASNNDSSASNATKRPIIRPPPTGDEDKQCGFVARGLCNHKSDCAYKHGFCALFTNDKPCTRKDCKFIHHKHNKSMVRTFDDIISAGQLKDPLCQTCHKSQRWNFSRYCLNCSQKPENKKEFCTKCGSYMWTPNTCRFCRT